MRSRRRSPLFSAVVLAGASLTAASGACGGDTNSPTPPGGSDAATSTADDAKAPDGAATVPNDAGAQSDACPPGSELPTPPCYFIR